MLETVIWLIYPFGSEELGLPQLKQACHGPFKTLNPQLIDQPQLGLMLAPHL